MKNFNIGERYKVNTPTFGNPATNIDAGNFGTVTGFAANSRPREFQLALKLYF